MQKHFAATSFFLIASHALPTFFGYRKTFFDEAMVTKSTVFQASGSYMWLIALSN